MPPVDLLLVSLGGTAGLREADFSLADVAAAGPARAVEFVPVAPARELRTFAWLDFAAAVNARRATSRALDAFSPRAVIYSSTTAALLAPVPGAIRFDAPACGESPGSPRRLAAAGRGAAVPLGAAAAAVERRAGWRRRRRRTPRRWWCRCRWRRRAAVRRATSPRSPTAPTRRRRAWTACSGRVGAGGAAGRGADRRGRGRAATRDAWLRARDGRGLARRAARGRVRFVGMLAPRRLPRAAAPLARLPLRRAARGLRDRAARGAGRRVRARHHALARPVRGAAARPRPRPAARRPRARDPDRARRPAARTTPSARPRRSRRSRRAAVDRVVAEQLLPRYLRALA